MAPVAEMDALDDMARRLAEEGRPRVGSLIVTVIGDAVAPRGVPVSAARLAAHLAPAGIGEGAVRTALSRLVADGTLVRRRAGRTGRHAFSPRTAAEAAEASALIYAGAAPGALRLSFGARPPRAMPLGGGWITREPAGDPRFRVAPEAVDALRGGAMVEPAQVEALLRLRADCAALAAAPQDPARAATARTLLVHRWRRYVLRHPELPQDWLPPGPDPRGDVAMAWRALRTASDRWWDAPAGPGEALAPLPADRVDRFGG